VGDNYDPDKMYDDDFTLFEHLENEYYDDERAWGIEDEEYEGEIDRHYFNAFKAYILDHFKVVSIALTREQIDQYNPPPNPAKLSDPRSGKFLRDHGNQSWEVDALRPEVLNAILTEAIRSRIDISLYESILEAEEEDKERLTQLKDQL
jgi:hypothetical protein